MCRPKRTAWSPTVVRTGTHLALVCRPALCWPAHKPCGRGVGGCQQPTPVRNRAPLILEHGVAATVESCSRQHASLTFTNAEGCEPGHVNLSHGVESREEGVPTPRSKRRPRKPKVEPALHSKMRQFWLGKGLQSSHQIAYLVDRGETCALSRDTELIDAWLEELHELVPQLDVVKMVGQVPSLLGIPPPTWGQRMRQLPEVLGCTVEEAAAMVSLNPSLLQCSAQELEHKRGEVQVLCPDLPEIQYKVKNSRVLTYDVDDMLERGQLLQELLPGVQLDKVLKHYHTVLTMSEDTMRQRVELLTPVFGKGMLAKFVSEAPNILLMRSETLLGNIRELQTLLPELSLPRLLASCPQLLSNSPATVAEKFGILQELLPGVSVSTILSQQPRLLSRSASTIRAQCAFLVEVFGSERATQMVSRQNRLLSYVSSVLETRMQQWGELLPDSDMRSWLGERPELLMIKFEGVAPRMLLLQYTLGWSAEQALELVTRHSQLLAYRLDRYMRLIYLREAIPYGQPPYAPTSVIKATPQRFREEMCGERYGLFLSSALEHLRQKGGMSATGSPPHQPPLSAAVPRGGLVKGDGKATAAMERLLGDVFEELWQALGADIPAAESLWEGYQLPRRPEPTPKADPVTSDGVSALVR